MKKFNNRDGFFTIMVLLIMGIISISSVFLIYTTKIEYLIINANRNNIQSYYTAEGKIYKLLYYDHYYHNEVLPRIRTYLKYGNLGTNYSSRIRMDKKDLDEGDNYRIVDTSFFLEDNRRVMGLKTSSTIHNSTKTIYAKINIINDFFELGMPVLYESILEEKIRQEYIEYINFIQKEIGLNQLDSDIMGIEILDYDRIVITEDDDGRQYFEGFRNTIEDPIICRYLDKDKYFLIIKGADSLSLESKEDNGNLILNGIIYTEGDVSIKGNVDFYGIFILNQGNIFLSPETKFNFEGILLSRDYPFAWSEYEDIIEINYNEKYIKANGIYLPGYIDTKIKVLQSN